MSESPAASAGGGVRRGSRRAGSRVFSSGRGSGAPPDKGRGGTGQGGDMKEIPAHTATPCENPHHALTLLAALARDARVGQARGVGSSRHEEEVLGAHPRSGATLERRGARERRRRALHFSSSPRPASRAGRSGSVQVAGRSQLSEGSLFWPTAGSFAILRPSCVFLDVVTGDTTTRSSGPEETAALG